MRLDNLKIAVTGGMGYVGSHTCKSLKAAGARVVSIDRRHVEQNEVEGVEYIFADYSDPEIWHALGQDPVNVKKFGSLDGVVHCAGTSLVGPSVTDPSEYYNNNVIKTIRMLDELRQWEHKPFIVFSSSAAVYGNPLELPIQESSASTPVNPYGNTKMMIERILRDYDTAYGIRSYCFRYFNAAGADVWDSELGPEPGDTHIIPRIFEAKAAGKPFKLFGTDYKTHDGTCVRDYIHVCDLALAHLRACNELIHGDTSRIYNLGTNTGYSNMEIINSFREVVGDIDVVEEPRREGDPDALIADAGKIFFEKKWTTHFSDLETIMKSFKDFYEKHNRL